MLGGEHGDFRLVPEPFSLLVSRSDPHDTASETNPVPRHPAHGGRYAHPQPRAAHDRHLHYQVERFAKHFGQPLDQLGPEEIRLYQLHLIEVKKASWSSFNQAVCGLRFLYQTTLPRPWVVQHIPFGKRPKKLPTVLGAEEVSLLIACVPVLKYRMVLLTLYAAGLRLSEATHLQIADIDSARMQLKVLHGKGNKQRLVPFSPRLLQELRSYWKQTRSTRSSFLARRRTCPSRAPRFRRPASWRQRMAQHPQTGDAAHPAAQLCDGTAGSGSRSADHWSVAGAQELHHDHDLSACAPAPFGVDAQSARLAPRATVSAVGQSAPQHCRLARPRHHDPARSPPPSA